MALRATDSDEDALGAADPFVTEPRPQGSGPRLFVTEPRPRGSGVQATSETARYYRSSNLTVESLWNLR